MLVHYERIDSHQQGSMTIPTYWIASAHGYLDGVGLTPSDASVDFYEKNVPRWD
jgi:hypothetical protein